MAGFQQESPLTEGGSPAASHESAPVSPFVNDKRKITRKSHRKSRAGCRNCKTRRIKCDETQPECGNCKRRFTRCDYAGDQALDSFTPLSQTHSDTNPSNTLALSDIELTFHWTTSTSHSLSAWRTGALQWNTTLIDIGLHNAHVLHLIFAFTALHLSICRPTRSAEYTATAEHHYSLALAQVTSEIARLSPANCDAVYTSVQLICFVNWARGPQAGEFLAFGADKKKRSDWLVMFRGIRTTLKSVGEKNFVKTHEPANRSRGRALLNPQEPFGYEAQLAELKAHVLAVGEALDDVHAVDVLIECYANRYEGRDEEYHVVFGWLFRMNDEFLERLQQRQAIPLIVFAHFVVLMHEMERFWYMKGWTHHVMEGIYDALPVEDRAWICWPMTSVGWIAP